MELAEGAVLSLPLFFLDESLAERDVNVPDCMLEVTLNADLLAHLCQNPAADASVALALDDYGLNDLKPGTAIPDRESQQVQLTLTQGPCLAAILMLDDGRSLVSPQMDMMPLFDLDEEFYEEE